MARHITADMPFGYRSGNTALHRIPAGLKLLALFTLSIAAFSSIPGLLLSALLAAIASSVARIEPWKLLRGSKPLIILSLFILVFKTVEPGASGVTLSEIAIFGIKFNSVNIPWVSAAGFFDGLISALRIMVSFAAGSLLFAVTTMRELRLSLSKAESAVIGIFVRRQNTAEPAPRKGGNISLGISLMLGFIPRFFELWETVNLACEARCFRRGFRRLALVIPLVTERMMELAACTAEALESRGI